MGEVFASSLERCGWRGLDVMTLNGLMAKEVKEVLKDTVWREARSEWRDKAMGKSKLEMTERLIESKCKARCVGIDCKRQRRIMARLRGGQIWHLRWEGGME